MSKISSVYPIVNFTDSRNQIDYIEKLLLAGAEIIQVRAKNLDQSLLMQFTIQALELKNKINANAKIIINDNVAVALLADGVHLGQEDQAVKNAREILGKEKIIGFSTHNLEQVKNAPLEFLDYVALGPIFNSKTKSGHAPEVGLEILKQAKKLITLPLVAIGGIGIENAKSVYLSGADCIAGIADFAESKDLTKLIEQYKILGGQTEPSPITN